MIALVEDLEASSATIMQRAGYQLPARFNADLVHRRFLCYPTATERTHHLHLVDVREDMDRCLRFRDRLRTSPQLAADYVALKRDLATRYGGDRWPTPRPRAGSSATPIHRAAFRPQACGPRRDEALVSELFAVTLRRVLASNRRGSLRIRVG